MIALVDTMTHVAAVLGGAIYLGVCLRYLAQERSIHYGPTRVIRRRRATPPLMGRELKCSVCDRDPLYEPPPYTWGSYGH